MGGGPGVERWRSLYELKVASASAREGIRRSEKAKVPEKASPEVQGLRDPRMSEQILTHKHQTHKHQTHNHAASGCRIHCGVEVTEHSLSKKQR